MSKRISLAQISTEELVKEFIDISINQGILLENLETVKYNQLFERIKRITSELRSRQGDQRWVLFKLYEHPNFQVRMNVAQGIYALDPARAIQEFERIKASRRAPYNFHAGMALSLLEMGISQLPRDP